MAILSDKELKDLIEKKNAIQAKEGPKIDQELQLGPSSFDLILGYDFGIINTRKIEKIDTKNMGRYEEVIEKEEHTAE